MRRWFELLIWESTTGFHVDTRDLNYDKYFTKGNEEISKIEDYHSHNTRRLDTEGMKELLMKLRFIREDLGLEIKAQQREIRSE